jgi:hypothetical protein
MDKVRNFSNFLQSSSLFEEEKGFNIKDRAGIFGGANVLKTGKSFTPIDISGTDVLSVSEKGAIGIQKWKFITGIKAIRKKGSKSNSTDYKKIILEGGKTPRDNEKIILEEGDPGFETASVYIQSVRNELEASDVANDPNKKGEINKSAELLYRLFVDKSLQAIISLRSILPKDTTDKEVDSILADSDVFGRVANVLEEASSNNTKEGHESMWKSLNGIAQEGEDLIKRIILILGKKIPKPEEGETKSELVQRGIADSRNQRDIFISTGNGAAEWLKEAVKKYSTGALQIVKEYPDSATSGMSEILRKSSEQFSNLKDSDSEIKESFISEIKSIAINRILPVFEEKRRNIMDEDPFSSESSEKASELSRDALLDQTIGIATTIDSYLNFFKNTPFSDTIEAEAKKYQDVVRAIAIKLSRTQNLSDKDLRDIANKLAELNAPSGDLSINEWKEKSLKEYDKQITANEFMKAGDAAMAKANELIDISRRIAYYDEQRSKRDIDKIIPRLTSDNLPAKDDRIDAIRGGDSGPVTDSSGNVSKDGLNKLRNNISSLLGTNAGDYESSQDKLDKDISDVAFRLSLITGKDYRKGDGWDLDSLNDDMFIFNKIKPQILGEEK